MLANHYHIDTVYGAFIRPVFAYFFALYSLKVIETGLSLLLSYYYRQKSQIDFRSNASGSAQTGDYTVEFKAGGINRFICKIQFDYQLVNF